MGKCSEVYCAEKLMNVALFKNILLAASVWLCYDVYCEQKLMKVALFKNILLAASVWLSVMRYTLHKN